MSRRWTPENRLSRTRAAARPKGRAAGVGAPSAWRDHLDAVGIAHSGIVEADYGLALSVKDPDGNALEFFMLAG